MLSIARSKLKVLCNNISFVSRSVKANYFIQTQVEHPTLLDYFILVYLFIGGWWREDFAWWRVRWWRDRSLVASLPGGEVTGNPTYTLRSLDSSLFFRKWIFYTHYRMNLLLYPCSKQCRSWLFWSTGGTKHGFGKEHIRDQFFWSVASHQSCTSMYEVQQGGSHHLCIEYGRYQWSTLQWRLLCLKVRCRRSV